MHLTFIVAFTVLILVNFSNVNGLSTLDNAVKDILLTDLAKEINEELKKLSQNDQSIPSELRKKRGLNDIILGLAALGRK
ncbi:unnamed protein product [Schistosoma margrebowiei]|uniref:Uncharacterized protein n=1 Tax=Schistosoma margrebowiei TaxID=48269 RepID=A0AA84ZCL6_9TREM|nr:unnamed protein product [Schistosoma margrebowiei]